MLRCSVLDRFKAGLLVRMENKVTKKVLMTARSITGAYSPHKPLRVLFDETGLPFRPHVPVLCGAVL